MSSLRDLVGRELGPSRWIEIDQARIDAFAKVTEDPQWIHTDTERAAGGPFGGTVAHGFLTLSLCVPMLYEVLPTGERTVVNYGVDRVRFPAPVPAGGRVRGRFSVCAIEDTAHGERATIEAVVECSGVAKPVCVAEIVVLAL